MAKYYRMDFDWIVRFEGFHYAVTVEDEKALYGHDLKGKLEYLIMVKLEQLDFMKKMKGEVDYLEGVKIKEIDKKSFDSDPEKFEAGE